MTSARIQVRELLEPLLFFRSDVLACLEGGSAATGRLDEYSDLDLEAIVADDAVESVLAAVRTALADRFGIRREYRIPEPAWHGFSQVFWLLERLPAPFYIDFALIRKSVEDKMTEVDRHGRKPIWFDKDGSHVETVSTVEAVHARGVRLYRQATGADFLMVLEARKGISRGNFVDAFVFAQRFVAGHLAVLMNLKHRPARADFGLRYLSSDFPASDRELIERVLRACDLGSLSAALEAGITRFEELKVELRSTWE